MDGRSNPVPKHPKRGVRWTSFIGEPAEGKLTRGLHEQGNPMHRVRVEHNKFTLLIHISNEDGDGWTTFALDRPTREWCGATQATTRRPKAAYEQLYI